MPRARRGYVANLQLKRHLRAAMTPAEWQLWAILRAKQFQTLRFRRQHGIGPYIVDFYCSERSLVIEVDGDNHGEENQIRKDKEREAYLQSLGLQVIRYRNDEVLKNLEGVIEDLSAKLP